MTNEALRNLCIKNNWYTRGTIEEYENLFRMNENHATYADLAMDIFIHSGECKLTKIEEELMKQDMPEINLVKLMNDLRSAGWTDKQTQIIFLAVHGDPDNGKTYITT